MSIELNLYCLACDSALETRSSITHPGDGAYVVKPCRMCLDRARHSGYITHKEDLEAAWDLFKASQEEEFKTFLTKC